MEIITMGDKKLEVNDLDYLSNLNQDELNSIATGPQDAFFESVNIINNQFKYMGINHQIDVTNKWNWKPGTYDKIKELLYRKLEMHKKSKSVEHLIQRTRHSN